MSTAKPPGVDWHAGRSWGGPGPFELGCLCAKADCGLVDMSRVDHGCEEHAPARGKTMREMHPASACPPTPEPERKP